MSAMMGEQDANRLSYMTNLQVEDVRHRPDCCRIVLFFASNTYFREKVVAKEYVMNGSGKRRLPHRWQQAWGRGLKWERQPSTLSHPLFPQDTGRLGPLQCGDISITNARPAAAGTPTADDRRQNRLGCMCEPDWAGSGRIAEVGRQWRGRERPCHPVSPPLVRGV
ncbi:uncharacterized protein LOC120616842 isoform X1 [Pteropus medius]|uniref:uncharacterized protein LOC120616842 isoform X1 n=1 Tax=Pteropus vampyrus TaxID=132908 RepID=UPI00196B1626|nr:uncharacterized protein LOC120616842 isoform X1 [Pteropus giganteus]